MEKKRLLGVKIICGWLVFFNVVSILLMLSSLNSLAKLRMPEAKKIELIQSKVYKQLNINSIEKFDEFHLRVSKASPSRPSYIGITLILIILTFGLWNLKKWAWFGLIFYSGLSIISGIILVIISKIEGINLQYIFVIINTIIVYYFTRPKMKAQFK